MTRIAAVDIGTNTVLLLVAELGDNGDIRAVHEQATITRLGESVDRTRALSPAAIARTNECLGRYAQIATALGAERIAVVGTSAMRDAAQGDLVRDHIARVFGVPARILSGQDEARLTFLGAMSHGGIDRAIGGGGGGECPVAFDVGGGSTEVVRGRRLGGSRAQIEYAESFDVGSVRLTERHVRSDPPTPGEISEIARNAAAEFARIPAEICHVQSEPSAERLVPIGLAGTMTTLASVALGLPRFDPAALEGATLSVGALRATINHLASLPLETRRALPQMVPERADVIVAGGIIALAILDRIGASSGDVDAQRVRISDRGVRWGLAVELLADR